MNDQGVKIVGLMANSEDIRVRNILNYAKKIGAEVEDIIPTNLGEIDWREKMYSANWLVNHSSTILEGDNAKTAWSNSMTFAELEGCKSVMVVEIPEKVSELENIWGAVIEKIRQINILFLAPEVVVKISQLEGIPQDSLLNKIRMMSLIPIVCSDDTESRKATISHSGGNFETFTNNKLLNYRWISAFLCGLSDSSNADSVLIDAASAKFLRT